MRKRVLTLLLALILVTLSLSVPAEENPNSVAGAWQLASAASDDTTLTREQLAQEGFAIQLGAVRLDRHSQEARRSFRHILRAAGRRTLTVETEGITFIITREDTSFVPARSGPDTVFGRWALVEFTEGDVRLIRHRLRNWAQLLNSCSTPAARRRIALPALMRPARGRRATHASRSRFWRTALCLYLPCFRTARYSFPRAQWS